MLSVLDSPLVGAFYALFTLLLLSTASVWLHSRAGAAGLDRRVATGLGVLMGLRLIQLPVYALAWLGEPAAEAITAPVERGVLLISLAIIAWLWARPASPTRGLQAINALPVLGAFILAAVMILYWLSVPAGSSFNYTNADYAWSAVSGLLAVLGLLQIVASPQRRPLGLLYMAVLLLGQVAHILLAEPFGNLPLLAQAAALFALPLLFTLPAQAQPAPVPEEAPDVPETDPLELLDESPLDESDLVAQDEALPEDEEDTDYFTLGPELPPLEEMDDAMALEEQIAPVLPSTPAFILDDPEPEAHTAQLSPVEELAQQLAQDLGADVCVLATHNDAQLQLEFQYGYNVLRSAAVEPARISLRQVPRLAAALQRGRLLRLEVDAADGELAALSQALRLSFPANLLMAPFEYSQDLRQWAVLALHIVTPWEMADEIVLQQYAESLGEQLAEALGVSGRSTPATQLVAPITHELEETRSELEALQQENARYRADVERLLAHIDSLQAAPGEPAAAVPNGSQELLDALQQENQRLKRSLSDLQAAPPAVAAVAGMLPSAQISVEQAKEELRLALEEVAALHSKLQAAQQAIVDTAEQQPGARIPGEQVELVASIAQELRQPLSSVMGYTDLLLGESVGLLGALQRKFLERVRSSTERMNTLVDNLIRIAELDPQGQSVQRSLVDLSGVIDDALSLLREPLQEKRIALRVNLPRQMPSLNTDKDALQQILYHLLQNADAATPAGGAIALRAVVEEQADLGQYVLIQVTDSGGGIPEDALPRVFSRVYRAQNPVIPGVGDSGVGLTIAETLTKALGGRIWVESQAGVGATFSVLLPLASPS
ncbi:MAG: hypothetical protein KF701_09680 [Anaerolineales bacterium]|nr:MAG: hypothetical protein KF701_09680 [Anaerolineales bacterium]